MPDLTSAKIDALIEESKTWAHPKCVDPLIRIIKQIRAENASLRANLEHIRHGAADRLASKNDWTMRGVLEYVESVLGEEKKRV